MGAGQAASPLEGRPFPPSSSTASSPPGTADGGVSYTQGKGQAWGPVVTPQSTHSFVRSFVRSFVCSSRLPARPAHGVEETLGGAAESLASTGVCVCGGGPAGSWEDPHREGMAPGRAHRCLSRVCCGPRAPWPPSHRRGGPQPGRRPPAPLRWLRAAESTLFFRDRLWEGTLSRTLSRSWVTRNLSRLSKSPSAPPLAPNPHAATQRPEPWAGDVRPRAPPPPPSPLSPGQKAPHRPELRPRRLPA